MVELRGGVMINQPWVAIIFKELNDVLEILQILWLKIYI